MRTEHMREFVLLSQTKNFTKTAELLYISQSVLSKHIALLEEELGLQLIIRSNPMQLSKAGELFLSHMESLLNEYDSVLEEMKSIGDGYTGKLGIGMLYYTKNMIVPTISKFMKDFTKIKLHFLSRTPIEIVNAVLTHSVDIGFVMNVQSNLNKLFNTFDLYNEPLVVMVSTEHPLAQKKSIHIAELEKERYINVDDNYYLDYLGYINNIVQKYGLTLKEDILVPTFEDLMLNIQLNQGISITSRSMKNETQSNIVYIDVKEDDLYFTRTMIYLKDNTNNAIPLFLESCKDNFQI